MWTKVIYGPEQLSRGSERTAVAHTKVQMQPALLSASIGTGCYGHVPITTVWPRKSIQPALPYWFQWPHTAGQHHNQLWKLHQCPTFTQTQNKIPIWNRVNTSLDGMQYWTCSDHKFHTTNISFSVASSITSWQIRPIIAGCHIHIPSLTHCQNDLSACPIWLLCTTTTRPSP